MLDVDTFLISLYVIVDDFCHSQSPRRRPGPEASLPESEVLTPAISARWSLLNDPDYVVGAGADAALLGTSGKSLVAVHDWTFLLGPGVVPGVNGVLLGYLMYTSRLVARPLALLGLVGGPLLFASGIAVLFGVIEADSVWQGISTLPVAAFEVLLGIWLIVKGFNPFAPLLTASAT